MNKRHSLECYTWHHGPMLPVRPTLNVQMIERPASIRTSSVYSVMGCTVNRFVSLHVQSGINQGYWATRHKLLHSFERI